MWQPQCQCKAILALRAMVTLATDPPFYSLALALTASAFNNQLNTSETIGVTVPLRNRGTQKWGWEWGFGGCSLRGQAIRRCPVYRKFKNSRTDWEVDRFYYHCSCAILNNIWYKYSFFPLSRFPLLLCSCSESNYKEVFSKLLNNRNVIGMCCLH